MGFAYLTRKQDNSVRRKRKNLNAELDEKREKALNDYYEAAT